MVTTRYFSLYSSLQFHTQANGRLFKPSDVDRWAIWCPGGAGVDYTFVLPDADPLAASQRDLMDRVTDVVNIPILSLNTQLTWGNDAAMALMDDLYDYAHTTLGYASVGADILCGSMGFTTACAWAKRNPTLVRSVTGLVPLCALDAFHDRDAGGFAASIEAAYGGLAAYNATVATRDPIQVVADIDHIPMHLWYSTDDPYILVSEVQAFSAAHGNCPITSLGAQGHAVDSLELDEVLAFLETTA